MNTCIELLKVLIARTKEKSIHWEEIDLNSFRDECINKHINTKEALKCFSTQKEDITLYLIRNNNNNPSELNEYINNPFIYPFVLIGKIKDRNPIRISFSDIDESCLLQELYELLDDNSEEDSLKEFYTIFSK